MKRITEQQAKQYFPLKENYGNTGVDNAAFFTITPSKRGDGWENVTYYTEKKIWIVLRSRRRRSMGLYFI